MRTQLSIQWCGIEAVQLREKTQFNVPHLRLAIAYVRLGRLGDAGAEVAKIKKLYSAITLQEWQQGIFFKDPELVDRCSHDLPQAGLPEGR